MNLESDHPSIYFYYFRLMELQARLESILGAFEQEEV